jgi:hypothetical protein
MQSYVVASCLAASRASWLAAVLSTPLVLPATTTGEATDFASRNMAAQYMVADNQTPAA